MTANLWWLANELLGHNYNRFVSKLSKFKRVFVEHQKTLNWQINTVSCQNDLIFSSRNNSFGMYLENVIYFIVCLLYKTFKTVKQKCWVVLGFLILIVKQLLAIWYKTHYLVTVCKYEVLLSKIYSFYSRHETNIAPKLQYNILWYWSKNVIKSNV